MAIINKTGIGEGNLIDAEHVTRIIDALSSGSSEITATGSFTGSFKGDGSQLTGITVTTATSASYAATASFLTGLIDSASFATTASFAVSASRAISSSTASLSLNSKSAETASYIDTPLIQNLTISGSDIRINGIRFSKANVTTSGTIRADLATFTPSADSTDVYEVAIVGESGSGMSYRSIGGTLLAVTQFPASSAASVILGQTSSSFDNFPGNIPKFGFRTITLSSNVALWVSGSADETILWSATIKRTPQ